MKPTCTGSVFSFGKEVKIRLGYRLGTKLGTGGEPAFLLPSRGSIQLAVSTRKCRGERGLMKKTPVTASIRILERRIP